MTRTRITAAARRIFRKMQATKDRADWWWSLQGDLHDELSAKPWQWPCVIGPNEETTSVPGSFAAQCDAEARALYDALDRS